MPFNLVGLRIDIAAVEGRVVGSDYVAEDSTGMFRRDVSQGLVRCLVAGIKQQIHI